MLTDEWSVPIYTVLTLYTDVDRRLVSPILLDTHTDILPTSERCRASMVRVDVPLWFSKWMRSSVGDREKERGEG